MMVDLLVPTMAVLQSKAPTMVVDLEAPTMVVLDSEVPTMAVDLLVPTMAVLQSEALTMVVDSLVPTMAVLDLETLTMAVHWIHWHQLWLCYLEVPTRLYCIRRRQPWWWIQRCQPWRCCSPRRLPR